MGKAQKINGDLIVSGNIGGSTSSIPSDTLESTENKVTSISSESTDTQYASAKATWDQLQDIRGVAEGKCATWVLSYAETISAVKTASHVSFKVYNYTTQEFEDKTTELLAGDYDSWSLANSYFNSTDNEIRIPYTGAYYTPPYIIFKATTRTGRTAFRKNDYYALTTEEFQTLIHYGDLILVTETAVPDRWYGGEYGGSPLPDEPSAFLRFYELENDLSNYVDKTSAQEITGEKTFTNGINLVDTGHFTFVNTTQDEKGIKAYWRLNSTPGAALPAESVNLTWYSYYQNPNTGVWTWDYAYRADFGEEGFTIDSYIQEESKCLFHVDDQYLYTNSSGIYYGNDHDSSGWEDHPYFLEFPSGGGTIATVEQLAHSYSNSRTYAVGDICINDDKLLSCTTAITTAKPFDAQDWTNITVYDIIDRKQDTLVSGTNIKTINSESILSSGNLNLSRVHNPLYDDIETMLPSEVEATQSGDLVVTDGRTCVWLVVVANASWRGFFCITDGLSGEARYEYYTKQQDEWVWADDVQDYVFPHSPSNLDTSKKYGFCAVNGHEGWVEVLYGESVSNNNVIELTYEKISVINLAVDRTFTLKTAQTNCIPEYKALITNTGSSAITLTFTGCGTIHTNDPNITLVAGTNSTATIPANTKVEVNIFDGDAIVYNKNAISYATNAEVEALFN